MLLFAGTTGFAQIEKHSFGAGVVNGFMYYPSQIEIFPDNQQMEKPAIIPYVFGFQGSHLKSTKNWLAWRTNVAFMGTSRYENYPESFDGKRVRLSDRDFIAEIGFGPMFTFQKEDYGIYLGGTLDLMFMASHRKGITQPWVDNWSFMEIPFPTVSAYLGYWQRVGNVNSPLFLEIALMRRHIPAIFTLFMEGRGPFFYHLTLGFRYEIRD
ncbi:MAG: hypothetical protein EA358_00050 [Flavobacteriales bacterium]|nr:MAG: hypothetical protein EA358_00050 [Flavobacteriales bacterium]